VAPALQDSDQLRGVGLELFHQVARELPRGVGCGKRVFHRTFEERPDEFDGIKKLLSCRIAELAEDPLRQIADVVGIDFERRADGEPDDFEVGRDLEPGRASRRRTGLEGPADRGGSGQVEAIGEREVKRLAELEAALTPSP
jgi:hypothetical protein